MTLLDFGWACLILAGAVACILVLDGLAWCWDQGTWALARWLNRRQRRKQQEWTTRRES
jgi:hypothetical protein